MDTNPSTHDEFDDFQDAFGKTSATADASIAAKHNSAEIAQKGWNTGDISAYRAAYRQAHSADA